MIEGKSKEEEKYIFISVFMKFCWSTAAPVAVHVACAALTRQGRCEWSQEGLCLPRGLRYSQDRLAPRVQAMFISSHSSTRPCSYSPRAAPALSLLTLYHCELARCNCRGTKQELTASGRRETDWNPPDWCLLCSICLFFPLLPFYRIPKDMPFPNVFCF